jgi:hypothetical protein
MIAEIGMKGQMKADSRAHHAVHDRIRIEPIP